MLEALNPQLPGQIREAINDDVMVRIGVRVGRAGRAPFVWAAHEGCVEPGILAALIVVVILGSGIEAIVLAMFITVWARFARMIRGDVLAVKDQDFVTLARITGVSTPVIIWRHIFPNTVNTLMVVTSILVGQVILLEAALSFLGLGLEPGAAAWGIMVAEGRTVILQIWWLALFPGVAITILVLALNFFGDWLRDSLDPKLRRLQ